MRQIKYTVAALVAFGLLVSSCKKRRDDQQIALPPVKVGALLSLTGNWSTLGITSKAAIDIALEDINAYMAKTGSTYHFASVVYDTKLDTGLASQYIASAHQAGCQFVLGPQSSAEAGAVKDYAGAHDMVVVSQGSTAGSLSIENDNLFRFCPDDKIEGAAMAKTIYNNGAKALITVARDDAGNKGLQLSTGASFTALGGQVSAITPYSSNANVDFAPVLADIKAKINQYKTTNNISAIAVYLASFDECVTMFQQAKGDSVLSSVRWYGGDGTVLSTALTGNTAAADFAIATKYFSPTFGLPAQAAAKWQPLADEIKKRTGIAPDAFALATYDAMWVIALSYNAYPYTHPELSTLRAEFVEQANKYYGATGATLLNAAGDRAIGSYDYWGIAKDGSSYKWVFTGSSE
jgi:branched-chain amino acid transport system substrate-binding protein